MSAKKYTKELLQPIVAQSLSFAEVMRRLNIKWSSGVQRTREEMLPKDPNWRRRPRPTKRKAVRPDKETLLREIDDNGYCATGRKYGVSDNAIRKWLKSYNFLAP